MESVKELEDSLFEKLNDNPLDISTLNRLGYIYLHSNNLLKSENFYLKSIDVDPEQFEPYVSLGLICTITLRLGKALYYLLKAKEQTPETPADLIKSIDEIKTAIFNKEGKLSQDEIQKLINDSYNNLERNNIEEALDGYLKLVNIVPDNEVLMLNLSLAFIKKQEYNLALEQLEVLIEKFPANGMAYQYASIASNFIDKPEQTKNYIYKSLEVKPNLADIIFNGKYANYKKDYDEELLENCPNCNEKNFKEVNIINQSINSINFNIINPIRIWCNCLNCNLVFANPRPSETALKSYAYELFLHSKNVNQKDLERIVLESNAYNDRLNIIENFVKNGKALDINSDLGIFSSLASIRGWNITSLENNQLKAKRIQASHNLEVKNTTFEKLKTNEKYDLVTIWESLEKNVNFLTYIDKVNSILNNNGIFALSFHSNNNHIVKSLGKNYPLWYYPDYVYFFDSKLLKEEIEKRGFKLVNTQLTSRKYLANTEFYFQKI